LGNGGPVHHPPGKKRCGNSPAVDQLIPGWGDRFNPGAPEGPQKGDGTAGNGVF
jgi:hypothetical protein